MHRVACSACIIAVWQVLREGEFDMVTIANRLIIGSDQRCPQGVWDERLQIKLEQQQLGYHQQVAKRLAHMVGPGAPASTDVLTQRSANFDRGDQSTGGSERKRKIYEQGQGRSMDCFTLEFVRVRVSVSACVPLAPRQAVRNAATELGLPQRRACRRGAS